MVDQNLVGFIRSSIQQGYDITTVQNHLLSQGYQLKDIQEAVSLIYGSPHVKHTIELSKTTIISIISGSLVIIITLIFVFSLIKSPNNAPPTLLDLSIESDTESIEAGENFPFRYSATQTGSQKRFDFRLRYEVLDFNNRLITSMEEEVAIETKVSDSKSIKIPSDTEPGRYVLKATALYDSKKASARINFKVEGEETPIEEPIDKPVEPSPEEPETPPIDEKPPLVIPEPTPKSSPRTVQDTHLITQDAIESSVNNINKAGKLCDSILDLRNRDKCFEKIAENAQTTGLCANIQSNSKRDTCYMNFAIEGDYSVCPKVENQYLKKSCESLAALNS